MSRIVLLGASNLTLAFSEIAALAAAGLGPGPIRVLAAAGHGRAYTLPSRVLGRTLPAIAACGLWRDLGAAPGRRTRALVADVGNDLALGAGLDELLEAIGGCLDRLGAAGAETIVVLPPVAGVERLSRARFLLLRSILFPGRRFDQGTITRRLRRLAAELRALAESAGARTAEPRAEWLGVDGIHIRRRRRRRAWRQLLAGWGPAAPTPAQAAGPRWSWLRAEEARFLAMPLATRQPSGELGDGGALCRY